MRSKCVSAIDSSVKIVAIGGAAFDAYGVPLRPEDIELSKAADAILLGAVGGPKWDTVDIDLRPERGLLALRKAMGLYANLRPVSVIPSLEGRRQSKLRSSGMLI